VPAWPFSAGSAHIRVFTHTLLYEVLLTDVRLAVPKVRRSTRKEASQWGDGPSRIGRIFGYARIFHGDDPGNACQAKALRAAGCSRVFLDTTSSGRWDRPELHRLLDGLRKGDMVVVLKLGCLSPSLKDLLRIMLRIAATGAAFRSISENIDTSTPGGRMMMRMVRALDDFDRSMISDRTITGIAAARREGRVLGRPRKLDVATEQKIAQSILSGCESGAAMARLHGVDKATISRIVAEYRDGQPKKGEIMPSRHSRTPTEGSAP
jgi:DNA invertase Pin-like site-specific DNA recombinase